MRIQLIRNATMQITYAGKTLLTDPMLSSRGSLPSFAGVEKNPTAELPFSVPEILHGVDGVIVSHDHPDHLDREALSALPRDVPVFCQPGDAGRFEGAGFERVRAVKDSATWDEISVSRTGGRHGQGRTGEMMGQVSGFVLQAETEPTVYWAGDSVWCEEVEQAIRAHQPEVILTHSGGAAFPGDAPIIMDAEQTLEVLRAAPEATVVAVHLETLDHCRTSRDMLRHAADRTGITESRLLIPKDGETVSLQNAHPSG